MKFKIDDIENLSDSRQVLESKPNKFTSIFIYIVLALISIFLVWAWFSEKEIVVKVSGIVRPLDEVYAVSNIIQGQVTEITMKNGEKVSKGDTLFKIDSKALENKKEQLNDQKKYLETDNENLKKLTNSINDNKNYFNDSKEDKEYYYKYKSYEAGNKVPLEDKEGLANSKNQLSKEKAELETLSKSINDNKNYNEKNSLYSAQYHSYISSRKIIENKIEQLNKAKNSIKDSKEGQTQLEQLELEIKNNNDELSKLKSDAMLQIKQSINKIDENAKAIDNNLSKLNESTDIAKEKNKTTVLAQIEEKININEQKLKEVKENISQIDESIEKSTVKSPVDGTLDIKSKLEPGIMIQSGVIIANILPQSKNYRVDLMIPNKDIANIKDGQEVKYSFHSLPYREYGFLSGKIDSLSCDSKVDSEKGISFYTGEGSLDSNSLYSNKGEESFIKPGMTCEGKIITRKEKMLYYLLEKLGLKN